MNWIEQVTILDLLVKGLIIGVVVSAPLGPVGVLCIQRTLNKGRWYGFVTGLGACLSDIIYALITGYGMSFMDEFLTKHQVLLQIVGSVMLFVFGVFTFRSNPVRAIRPVSANKGTYLHNFMTAFFVTLSNPLIIFLFIGLFARFSFVIPNHHNKAPIMIAKYPNNWKPMALPGITNEKRANNPMNKKMTNGLESVTKKAVMKL